MRKVLLTGGIGSGKSVVADVFRQLGGFVYDSDSETKALYGTNAELREGLLREFGPSVLTQDGVDAKALASVVFGHPEALNALEGLAHPAVRDDFLRMAADSKCELAVMESAIAAEKPLFKDFFDVVIYVDAPVSRRMQRVCGRDGVTEASVRSRMAAQAAGMPEKVDIVINNDKDVATLQRRAARIWKNLLKNINN